VTGETGLCPPADAFNASALGTERRQAELREEGERA
jgi:hypothetical protein